MPVKFEDPDLEEGEEEDGEDGDDVGIDDSSRGGAYHMNCRMYENEFPEIDDVVMVQVRSIAEMGAYVALLEYNNTEGMILLSELTRRRIRSVNKLIRVGKQEVCMVLRVDKEKGYIDLSKRRVSAEDVAKCDERFQRSKAVHSIVRHVSEVQRVEMEALYRKTAWRLYAKFGHAYEAFCAAITDPDSIFNAELMPELEPELRDCMLDNIKKRLTPTAIKIRADIEVTCFHYEGINVRAHAAARGSPSRHRPPGLARHLPGRACALRLVRQLAPLCACASRHWPLCVAHTGDQGGALEGCRARDRGVAHHHQAGRAAVVRHAVLCARQGERDRAAQPGDRNDARRHPKAQGRAAGQDGGTSSGRARGQAAGQPHDHPREPEQRGRRRRGPR